METIDFSVGLKRFQMEYSVPSPVFSVDPLQLDDSDALLDRCDVLVLIGNFFLRGVLDWSIPNDERCWLSQVALSSLRRLQLHECGHVPKERQKPIELLVDDAFAR